MRKIFFLTTLLMMIFSAVAFAEEAPAAETPAEEVEEQKDEPYVYTSEDFQFTITCPIKPVAVVQNPWEEPEKRGELLVFANEGFDIQYGYMIQVNAFEDGQVPDFNKGSIAAIGDYLTALKQNNGFGDARLINITKNNKGVWAITAKTIDMVNPDTGEVEGEFVADKQYIYTFFRTPAGRCISIQLVSANLQEQKYLDVYRYSVSTFKDTDDNDKNSKKDKKKDKKDKQDKKDKKDKK